MLTVQSPSNSEISSLFSPESRPENHKLYRPSILGDGLEAARMCLPSYAPPFPRPSPSKCSSSSRRRIHICSPIGFQSRAPLREHIYLATPVSRYARCGRETVDIDEVRSGGCVGGSTLALQRGGGGDIHVSCMWVHPPPPSP